jgi:ligand-binding sensor domain-containing protein
MFELRDGRIAVATTEGVGSIGAQGFVSVDQSLKYIYSITQDRDRSIWFGDIHKGLFHLSNGGPPSAVGSDHFVGKAIISLLGDKEGRVWIGLRQGGLVVYRDGAFRGFSSA